MATNPKILLEAAERGLKAGAKTLSRAERTKLGRTWGLAVGAKNPDLLQTSGFLYNRDAAAKFNSLGPDQTVIYMDPAELKSLAGAADDVGTPGEVGPIQINGTVGKDGGLNVESVAGAEGIGTLLAFGEGRKVPVIVPKFGKQAPQYASYQGRRVNGLRGKLSDETLVDMYTNQQGRSIDLLRWQMDPANAEKTTIGYAGNDDDFWGDLRSKLDINEMASQDYFTKDERRFDMREMQGIRTRQVQDLNARYKQIRDAMGKEAFDKLRGTSKLTPGSVYGATGEFADMPLLTTRGDIHRVNVPEGTRDGIPAWEYARETGIHTGTLDTAGRFTMQYDRDRYDNALAALQDPLISPEAKKANEKFVAGYTKMKENVSNKVAEAIKGVMPDASLVDKQAVVKQVRQFAEEFEKEAPDFTSVEWFSSVKGQAKLKQQLAQTLNISEFDASDVVSAMVDYYMVTAKSTSEMRHYLTTGVNNPLLMHDMSSNKAHRLAEYMLGIPEFQQYGKELNDIIEEAGAVPGWPGLPKARAEDRPARERRHNAKIFEILKRRGYDSIAYMNQAETMNAGAGLMEPSFILPPDSPVQNLSKLAPKYAKDHNLKAVMALFAPLLGAIPEKKAEASANPLSPGYYKGDDGKVFYSDGKTLEEVLKK